MDLYRAGGATIPAKLLTQRRIGYTLSSRGIAVIQDTQVIVIVWFVSLVWI